MEDSDGRGAGFPALLASERTSRVRTEWPGNPSTAYYSMEEQVWKGQGSQERTPAAQGPDGGRDVTPQRLGQLTGGSEMGLRKRRPQGRDEDSQSTEGTCLKGEVSSSETLRADRSHTTTWVS